jgi:hypothetical protein
MIADAERRQMPDRIEDIFLVRAGLADSALDDRRRLVGRKAAGILPVVAIDDKAKRFVRRAVIEPDLQPAFGIDMGDKFAFAQIGDDFFPQIARDAKGESDTGSAAIEPENETRMRLGAPVHPGIDAKRAAKSMEMGTPSRNMDETRPPDERTIAKDPKIAHIASPMLQKK